GDDVQEETTKKEKKNKSKEKIEALEQEVLELKDRLLRNAAELENFKKRMTQERINDRKYASKNLINDVLNPLEQLNKIVNLSVDNDTLKNFLIGFKMINDQLYQILESDGLKAIEALNQPFDPKLHYAVDKVVDKDKAKGLVIEVIQKGYTYKEQLLRPAMVKVNEWSEENGKDE
ncbi:MAG: nucleotide exchange factor GrpE, partial [Acholeplasmataceae bacterium]